MNAKIRYAVLDDADQIVSLCEQHAHYEKATFEPENKLDKLLETLFHIESKIKCLVVVQGDELIGYATFLKQYSTWDASFYLYIDCLFLKEKARGQGLGKQLMARIKKHARAENCNLIQWQTPLFNSRAINFYRRLGAVSKQKESFIWEV